MNTRPYFSQVRTLQASPPKALPGNGIIKYGCCHDAMIRNLHIRIVQNTMSSNWPVILNSFYSCCKGPSPKIDAVNKADMKLSNGGP